MGERQGGAKLESESVREEGGHFSLLLVGHLWYGTIHPTLGA